MFPGGLCVSVPLIRPAPEALAHSSDCRQVQKLSRSWRRTESYIMLLSKGHFLGGGGEHSAQIVRRSAQDAYLAEAGLMAAPAAARVPDGAPNASLLMLGCCTAVYMS